MWNSEAVGQSTWADVNYYSVVGDGVIPVLSGNLMLYEVRETYFQETYTCAFHKSVLDLAPCWGCHNLGVVIQDTYVGHSLDYYFFKVYVEL